MFLLGDYVSLELLLKLGVASLLWVLLQLIIRFHPRGIEIVGAIICFLGLLWWVSNPRLFPPFGAGLFLLGFAIHALGRFLYWLKKA